MWLIKTDNYGNEQWKRIYGDSFSDDTGYSLKKTGDGGYIVTGTKTSFSTGLTDVWLIKTNVNGYIKWNLTIDGGEDDWSYSVDETMDEGYIITGLTNSYSNGDYDLWLIKVELVNYENQPPNIPSDPDPPDDATYVDVDADLSWNCSDPDGNNLIYDVYFEADDSTPDILVSDDQTDTFYNLVSLKYETTYYWQIIAKDEHGASTPSPIWRFTTIEEPQNQPPIKPETPWKKSKVDKSLTFCTETFDPDGEQIWYWWEWGDGEHSGWFGPNQNNETACATHSWKESGPYTIKVKAKDVFDAESEWATLDINIPRCKNFLNHALMSLFSRLINLFPTLLQRPC